MMKSTSTSRTCWRSDPQSPSHPIWKAGSEHPAFFLGLLQALKARDRGRSGRGEAAPSPKSWMTMPGCQRTGKRRWGKAVRFRLLIARSTGGPAAIVEPCKGLKPLCVPCLCQTRTPFKGFCVLEHPDHAVGLPAKPVKTKRVSRARLGHNSLGTAFRHQQQQLLGAIVNAKPRLCAGLRRVGMQDLSKQGHSKRWFQPSQCVEMFRTQHAKPLPFSILMQRYT